MATPPAFWVRLPTNMFEANDAFKILEKRHPEKADAVVSLFVKMVAHAGKSNADGELLLSGVVPMGRADIADMFDRPTELVDFAVDHLVKHQLVMENEDGYLEIADWFDYVNTDAMAKVREGGANRTRKWREGKKLKQAEKEAWEEKARRDAVTVTSDVTGDVSGDGHKNKKVNLKDNLKDSIVEQSKEPEPPKEQEKIPYAEIIDYLNRTAGKHFKNVKSHHKWIDKRWKDGHRIDDFKYVIDVKTEEWDVEPRPGEKDMRQYLQPETLFGEKFDGYRNQKMRRKKGAANEREQGNSGGTGLAGFINQ